MMEYSITNDEGEVWLTYAEGSKRATLHLLACMEGIAIYMSPDMLVQLRDGIQDVLDAMGG